MARNVSNPLLKGISGKIGKGKIVVKRYKYGEVISSYPKMTRIKPSAAQKDRRMHFMDSSKRAKHYVENQEQFVNLKIKIGKHLSLYHAAMAYYVNLPSPGYFE